MYCDENRWRSFCLLRIIQESGVYQLGVPQGQGDSSAPSTTDPLICGFCLVPTPNTGSKTVEQSIVTWMFAREFITNRHPVAPQLTNKPCTDGQTDGVKPIYPLTTSLCRGYNYQCFPLNEIEFYTKTWWKSSNWIWFHYLVLECWASFSWSYFSSTIYNIIIIFQMYMSNSRLKEYVRTFIWTVTTLFKSSNIYYFISNNTYKHQCD